MYQALHSQQIIYNFTAVDIWERAMAIYYLNHKLDAQHCYMLFTSSSVFVLQVRSVPLYIDAIQHSIPSIIISHCIITTHKITQLN